MEYINVHMTSHYKNIFEDKITIGVTYDLDVPS